MSNSDKTPPRNRGKLLRKFRKQYRITLTEFGKRADLSQPMLSQFERGDHNLSDEAWTRVLAAMSGLITEDNAKRLAEIGKAKETAAKLGAPGLDPHIGEIVFGDWIFGLGSASEIEAERIRLQGVSNISELIDAEVERQAQQLLGTTEAGEALQKKLTEYMANNVAPKLFEYAKKLEGERDSLRLKVSELEEELRALKAKEQSNG